MLNKVEIANDLLPRKDLTGRENIICKMRKGFDESEIVLLSGSAGSGKTALANEFAYRILEDESPDQWRSLMIFSETNTQIETGLRKIAAQMRLDINRNDTFEQLSDRIKSRMSGLKWNFLIIFDDLFNYEDIESILGTLSLLPEGKVKFLVTSRNKNVLSYSSLKKTVFQISPFD